MSNNTLDELAAFGTVAERWGFDMAHTHGDGLVRWLSPMTRDLYLMWLERAALSAPVDSLQRPADTGEAMDQNDTDQLDAERYRFWRDWTFKGLPGDNPELFGICIEAEFESALDSAIAQGKEPT